MEYLRPDHNFLIILLVAAVFYGQVRCDASVNALGCTFDDDKFTLHTKEPKFGNKLEPKIFNGSDDLLNFIKYLDKITGKVMNETLRDEWDPFIKFIQAYNQQKGQKSLESFYEDYHVEYQPKQDAAGFLIEVAKQMKEKYSGIDQHFYLVTVDLDLPMTSNRIDKWFSKLEKVPEVPLKWGHDHVAGALRIQVDNRPGYLLIDPDLDLDVHYPVIFMKDREFPHNADRIAELSKEQNTFGNIINTEYIYARIKETNGKTYHMYNMAKPFCSFLDTTVKRRLLFIPHKLLKRGPSGKLLGYFLFELMPLSYAPTYHKMNSKQFPTYQFEGFHAESNVGPPSKEAFAMEPSKPDPNINQLEKPIKKNPFISDLCITMETSEDDIVSKMNTLRKELFNHEDTILKIFTLQQKLEIIVVKQEKSDGILGAIGLSNCF